MVKIGIKQPDKKSISIYFVYLVIHCSRIQLSYQLIFQIFAGINYNICENKNQIFTGINDNMLRVTSLFNLFVSLYDTREIVSLYL